MTRLLEHAQKLEAMLDTPYDPTAAGLLVPDVVTRPDKVGRGSRKRLSDLHGSVTMRDVGGEAEKRRLEEETKEEAVKEKKRQALEKKEAAQIEVTERAAAFALCEEGCVCEVVPCLWTGWKRCPNCGPKKGLCKGSEHMLQHANPCCLATILLWGLSSACLVRSLLGGFGRSRAIRLCKRPRAAWVWGGSICRIGVILGWYWADLMQNLELRGL